jgi:hypothetical protein
MSVELNFPSDMVELAIHDATIYGRSGNGTVIVGASGNSGATMAYPATLDDVIAVGNMSMCNTRVSNTSCDNYNGASSYGPELDVMAPGAKILTTNVGSGTTTVTGSSAASPHAAGTVALMLSANPNLVVSQIKTMLNYSCNRVGGYCYNWTPSHPEGPWHQEMGYGRINAYNAVQLALRAISFGPSVYNIPQQNSTMTGSTGFILVNTGSCTSLASAWYSVDRYEVTTNIVFPYTNNPLIICSSNGWSAANPNDAKNFAVAVNVTNTSATLKTWVYKMWASNYQYVGWYPTTVENIKFNYSVITCNSSIDYQTSKGVTKTVSGPVPFEFDDPGPVNDQAIYPRETADGIMLYPNPTNGSFRVIHNFPEGEDIDRIELLNNTGFTLKVLPMQNKIARVTEVDVSNFSPGIYLLRITTTKGVYTKKLVRQ